MLFRSVEQQTAQNTGFGFDRMRRDTQLRNLAVVAVIFQGRKYGGYGEFLSAVDATPTPIRRRWQMLGVNAWQAVGNVCTARDKWNSKNPEPPRLALWWLAGSCESAPGSNDGSLMATLPQAGVQAVSP